MSLGSTCDCDGPKPGHRKGCPLAGDFPLEQERDQVDILATALFLAQERPELTGMSATAWVETAISMRQRIAAISGVFFADDDDVIERLARP